VNSRLGIYFVTRSSSAGLFMSGIFVPIMESPMKPTGTDRIDDIANHIDEVVTIVEDVKADPTANVDSNAMALLQTAVTDAKAATDTLEDEQERGGERRADDGEQDGQGEWQDQQQDDD
jgi:hypothetical protein